MLMSGFSGTDLHGKFPLLGVHGRRAWDRAALSSAAWVLAMPNIGPPKARRSSQVRGSLARYLGSLGELAEAFSRKI